MYLECRGISWRAFRVRGVELLSASKKVRTVLRSMVRRLMLLMDFMVLSKLLEIAVRLLISLSAIDCCI